MALQVQQINPAGGVNMFQPGQEPDKLFLAEAENLEVVGGQHSWVLNNIAERLLQAL